MAEFRSASIDGAAATAGAGGLAVPHPVRSAWIDGVPAQAIVFARAPLPHEMMSVKDAVDIDRAMGDPDNAHCCPLCNEYFGTEAFRQHAPACIDARVPRGKVWLPPGTKGAMAHYSEERPRRPGSGKFDSY